MPCQACGAPLRGGRSRLCKTCGFQKAKESAIPDGAGYLEPTTPAGYIARHLDAVLDIIDFDNTSRYTNADHNAVRDLKYDITDRNLTQTDIRSELAALLSEYDNPDIQFELRHALQYAYAYNQDPADEPQRLGEVNHGP